MLVTVQKAFLVRGERQEAGSVVELPDDLARELISLQKAAPAETLAPASGPMTTESGGALVAGRKRKEKRNVQ
jgi:hypothetical protein